MKTEEKRNSAMPKTGWKRPRNHMRSCVRCKATFTSSRNDARYCSKACVNADCNDRKILAETQA